MNGKDVNDSAMSPIVHDWAVLLLSVPQAAHPETVFLGIQVAPRAVLLWGQAPRNSRGTESVVLMITKSTRFTQRLPQEVIVTTQVVIN